MLQSCENEAKVCIKKAYTLAILKLEQFLFVTFQAIFEDGVSVGV